MRGTAALITVTLLLGGCAGGAAEPASTTIGAMEPSEVATPSVEVSVAADAAADLQPPEMPALAREQTPEGAVAFAEWWFDTLNYATVTGDTTELAAASDPECETCASYIAEIDDAYADGGSIRGGLFDTKVQAAGPIQQSAVVFPVLFDVSEATFLGPTGAVSSLYVAESGSMDFIASWSGGAWKVGGLTMGPQ